jgi:hypothetical protein
VYSIKKKKRKTIGIMTRDRGAMPHPTVTVESKRKKNDRKKSKVALKRVDWRNYAG